MNINNIKIGLKDYGHTEVDIYLNYLKQLETAKDKKKQPKNPWMKYKSDAELVSFFKKVALDGLSIDGEHVTLQSTGISFDYIAYKNKMLLVYPETLFDVALVYKDDTFKFEKQSGNVVYTHQINNPFDQSEDKIIGGYCIIKNKRGEFITLLSASNIAKHRKVAKTDSIWSSWFHEMCLKTVIKKACRQHFQDIYQNIETLDNENSDITQLLGISVENKAAVEEIETLEKLEEFYHANKDKNAGVLKDFNLLITNRKSELEANIEKAKKTEAPKDKDKTQDNSEREPGSDDK